MATKKLNIEILKVERENWKNVCEEVLVEEIKVIYIKRKEAVDMYIEGYSLTDINSKTGIDKSTVIKLLKKCLSYNKDTGEVLGYTALIPYKRISEYKRVEDNLVTKGYNGSFNKLLGDYPHLISFINDNYFRENNATLEKNMSLSVLHSKFIEKCRQIGIQDYEYPFCTSNKGYKSLCKYVRKLEQENTDKAIKREHKDIRQKYKSTSYGKKYTDIPLAPFSVVQLDGHKIDALYTVQVENDKGEVVNLTATRLWLIAVIDTATRVILGYSLSREENYSQTDVLKAIQRSIIPHRCIKFTIDSFKYPQNGGFSSTAIKETEWALFDEIMLDNAKAHLAINVVEKLTSKLKCAVNFGSVATPETRGIVERVFRTLEDSCFHRLASTTGSNTRDVKRKNAEANAIKYKITYDDLIQIIENAISLYNNSLHSSLDNQTPLECMERRIHEAMMFPYIANEMEKEYVNSLTHFTCTRKVCGGFKQGKKPFINYEGAEYRNDIIALSNKLVGSTLTLEINPDDISKVKAYFLDGSEIGYLTAVGEWGRKPHSLKTRKAALKFARENKKNNDRFYAPLTEYENDLRKRAKNQRKARTKADTVKIEQSKPSTTEFKEEKKYTKENNIININNQKMQVLTDDQLEQLMSSSSVEEAYKKGVF
jgi:putative transposase